MVFLYYFIWW